MCGECEADCAEGGDTDPPVEKDEINIEYLRKSDNVLIVM